MIDLTNINKVFLFPEPVDFRYGMNALCAMVLNKLITNKTRKTKVNNTSP